MYKDHRDFLKDSIRKRVDFTRTAQSRGIAPPPPQKRVPPDAPRILLVPPESRKSIPGVDLETAIARRKSRRRYSSEPLSMDELSFLLWATQGLRSSARGGGIFRTVPSAGNRHPFETYVLAFRVTGLEHAIYRYLPLEHALVEVARRPGLELSLVRAAFGQEFCGASAATFVWTVVPERTEWRYAEASAKVIALDAGHVCQNLYLACEAIGAGTCAVGAYDQELMDELLGLDGDDEFTIYLAPVGKVPTR